MRLEQLFNRCDTQGKGYIDLEEFRDLCASFEITRDDADVIFADLDHDGDGRISFEDFSFGFRDFLTPGSRRGSVQLGLSASPNPNMNGTGSAASTPIRQPSFRFEKMDSIVEVEAKQQEMERKHRKARGAWKNLADHLSKDDIRKFLGSSGDKIFTLYEELQTSEVPPHLMDHFQDLISALVVDVKKIDEKNRLLEERFARERESHSAHLKTIEAELDAQMAKVEQQAMAKAKQEYDLERKELQQKMDAELSELQTQLSLFQKVDTWLNKEKDGMNHSEETIRKLETAAEENRLLKISLNDTQANIALLRGEMTQVRNQYESKCTELTEERENRMEYMYELENIHRQLELLRNANQKLQDTNDGLCQMVDLNSARSPRFRSRFHEDLEGDLASELAAEEAGSGSSHLAPHRPPAARRKRPRAPRSGYTGSDNEGGSFYDSDSLRSRGSRASDRPKLADAPFAIKRLLEDLDSGTSTLPAEENIDEYENEGSRLEAAEANKKSIEQKERDLTEVSTTDQSQDPKSRIDVIDHAMREKQKPTPAPRSTSLVRRPSAAAKPKMGHLPTALMALEATGPPDRTYKVVFAGDAAVGKTSFINRITKGIFLNNLSSTLGVDFQVKTMRIDEKNIALQLWDTAGQERFRSVTRSYFRRADGVMLLYDVTNERSFLSVRQWIEAVDDVAEKRIPIMLCGNKLDLRADLVAQGTRCVSTEDGERVARDHSATFLETSSKDGSNILDALIQLSRDMCSTEDTELQTSILKIREDEQPEKKTCCRK